MWYDLLQCIGPPQCNYTSNECPWQNPEKITYCTWHIWHRKGVIDAEHMGRIWFQDQSDSRSRLAKTFKAYRLTPHQMEKAKSQITELEMWGWYPHPHHLSQHCYSSFPRRMAGIECALIIGNWTRLPYKMHTPFQTWNHYLSPQEEQPSFLNLTCNQHTICSE